MVPKIIHFFHNDHFDDDILDIITNYKSIYPNFTFQLWTSDSIRKELIVISKELGYYFEDLVHSNKMSSLYKYIFLYKYGGMWFDKDIFPVKDLYSIVGDKPLVMYLKGERNDRGNKEASTHLSPDFISCTVGNLFLSTLLKKILDLLAVQNGDTSTQINEVEMIHQSYMNFNNANDVLFLRDKFFYRITEKESINYKNIGDLELRFVYCINKSNSGSQIEDGGTIKLFSNVIQNGQIEKVVWPKVSCLCISQNNEKIVRRCIKSFENQLYENKELIIVYEDTSLAKGYIKSLTQKNIKVYHVPIEEGKKSLGELRNISIQKSTGDFIMQWDDDDIYDPHRIIECMISILKNNAKACVLDQFTMYDELKDKYSFSKKRKWEGSILVDKNSITLANIDYPKKVKGEDTPFFEKIESTFHVTVLHDPWLYMYVTHHNNTFDYKHHDLLVYRKLYFFKTYIDSQSLKLKYFRSLILAK